MSSLWWHLSVKMSAMVCVCVWECVHADGAHCIQQRRMCCSLNAMGTLFRSKAGWITDSLIHWVLQCCSTIQSLLLDCMKERDRCAEKPGSKVNSSVVLLQGECDLTLNQLKMQEVNQTCYVFFIDASCSAAWMPCVLEIRTDQHKEERNPGNIKCSLCSGDLHDFYLHLAKVCLHFLLPYLRVFCSTCPSTKGSAFG